MGRLLSSTSVACLLLTATTLAAPVQSSHQSGGLEHIVIIDNNHPATPAIETVLQRLALHTTHPDVIHIYNNTGFRGFSASMQSHCLDKLANMTDLLMVEKAISVSRSNTESGQVSLAYERRPGAPWGLQRISSLSPVPGNTSDVDYTYSYADEALGKGADIYMVDTGIDTNNVQFNGRASMLWSFDDTLEDQVGHGTHVSGTAAGNTFGIASNANLIGVKAIGPEGGWSSSVVAAIDMVMLQHAKRQSDPDFVGSVMSISLETGPGADVISTAVSAAVNIGVHACIAAGNSAVDACTTIPASSGGLKGPAITVGSIDPDDSMSSFSNFGDCVDVYAPGSGIMSAWIGASDAVRVMGGTSMSTPHVTGLVAYAMSNKTLAASPALMKQWVRMTALQISNGTTTFSLANNGMHSIYTTAGLELPPTVGLTYPTTTTSKRAADDARPKDRGLFGLVESSARLQGDSWTGRSKRSLEKAGAVGTLAKLFEKGAWVRATSWMSRVD